MGGFACILVVAGNGRIYDSAPGIDTARHALAGFDALLPQPVDYIEAPDSVVAKDDQRAFIGPGIEVLELARHRTHGHQGGTFDFGQGEFVGLADVDQMELFPSIETFLDVLGFHF